MIQMRKANPAFGLGTFTDLGTDGISLYSVRGDAEGLNRKTLEAIDLTRKLAQLDFSNVKGELLGEKGKARALRRAISSQMGCPEGARAECVSDSPSASPTTCDVAAVPRN